MIICQKHGPCPRPPARGRRGADFGFLADFCGFLPRYRNPKKLASGARFAVRGSPVDASRSRFAVRLPVKNARVFRFGGGRDFRAGRG